MRILRGAVCSALLLCMTQVLVLQGQAIDRYQPSDNRTRELEADCKKELPDEGLNSPFLIKYTVYDPSIAEILETNAPNYHQFIENCSTVGVTNTSNDTASSNGTDVERSILRVKDGDNTTRCYDVLLFDRSDPVICGYISQPEVNYRPVTEEERRYERECKENFPLPPERSGGSLVRFFAQPFVEFSSWETGLPNENPFTENCDALYDYQMNANDTLRPVMEYSGNCRDVLFYAEGTSDPVACFYVTSNGKTLRTSDGRVYTPSSPAEEDIEKACKKNFPPLEQYYEVFLRRYTLDDSTRWTLQMTDAQNTNTYSESCSNIGITGTGSPNRSVLVLYRMVEGLALGQICADVLFLADNTDPVICYYQRRVHALDSKVYKSETPKQEEIEKECKKNLPPLNQYKAVLRWYDITDETRWIIQKTAAPNDDPYSESCSTIGNSGTREVLILDSDVGEADGRYCSDVLFFINDTYPVTCFYNAIIAGPLVIDYQPRTPEEEEFQKDCQENLPHPENTTVHLVRYESNPEGKFPAYNLKHVLHNNTENAFSEECAAFHRATNNSASDETRAVIQIHESTTCHDVLFFVDGTDPVVCLYVIDFVPPRGPVTFRYHRPSGILSIVLLSFSVIASAIILITHILFPVLLTLPTKVIMNLVTAFLVGDIFFIIQVSLVLTGEVDTVVFVPIVLIAYYFLYARFVWMALSGFEMCRTIHVGTQLRFNSAAKRMKFLIFYLIVGWTLPLLPTIIMGIAHYQELEYEQNRLWGLGGIVIVIVPVLMVAVFNIGTLLYLSYVLHMARQWQVKVTTAIQSKKRKTNFFRIFIIIISLLGVTWILLLAVQVDAGDSTELLIIANILNTIQPIFVAISFICTKKIYRKYKALFCLKEQENDTRTETSQQNSRYSRFRNRKLISFLFTDKELTDMVAKNGRFQRQRRADSKLSQASIMTQDSSLSLGAPPVSNGISTPPKFPPSLDPITEELETAEMDEESSPTHVTVDLKDSAL